MRLRLRIGKLMKQRKMTIQELAEQAQIAPNTARGFYHGITARVDLPTLDKVAKALEVSPLELFELVEEDRLALRMASV